MHVIAVSAVRPQAARTARCGSVESHGDGVRSIPLATLEGSPAQTGHSLQECALCRGVLAAAQLIDGARAGRGLPLGAPSLLKRIPNAMMSGQIAIDSIKTCIKRDKLDKLGSVYERNLDKKFLKILKLKRVARDRIFESDENLKKFLSLWETYRSSQIISRGLI